MLDHEKRLGWVAVVCLKALVECLSWSFYSTDCSYLPSLLWPRVSVSGASMRMSFGGFGLSLSR